MPPSSATQILKVVHDSKPLAAFEAIKAITLLMLLEKVLVRLRLLVSHISFVASLEKNYRYSVLA